MQVNSAQDYLTAKKRQVIASTLRSAPPPQSRRTNTMITSVVANGATQRQRFVAPGAPGGATYTSLCCSTGGPLALGIVVDAGVVRFNVIPPMSVTATRVTG